jgi:hypothetical protein
MRSIGIALWLVGFASACRGSVATSTTPASAHPWATVDIPPADVPSATTETAPTRSASGTQADAERLLAEFTKPGADPGKLTVALEPTAAELALIFDQSVLAAVGDHVEKLYRGMGDGLELKEVRDVRCFSSDDIKAWTKDVERSLPGGYRRVGPKLKPGLTLCRFKGRLSYDSLVFVAGRWVFVPKPFRAIRD